jgi:hypothetical protein
MDFGSARPFVQAKRAYIVRVMNQRRLSGVSSNDASAVGFGALMGRAAGEIRRVE